MRMSLTLTDRLDMVNEEITAMVESGRTDPEATDVVYRLVMRRKFLLATIAHQALTS